MARSLIDRDRGYRALLERVQELHKGTVVKVGVMGAEASAPKEGADGLTLLAIAVVHEFGLEELGIPERSFIRDWVDENRPAIQAQMKRVGAAIVKGTPARVAFERFGEWAVAQVKKRIVAHIDPPNADSTVAAKGSSTPLVDSSQLLNSITHATEGA